MIKNILGFVLFSLLLIGCGNSSSNNDNTTKTTAISGKAIDGYIDGAKVVVKNKSTGEVIATVSTDVNGSFDFDKPDGIDVIVEISGGTDTSTGEAFSGTMKNVISKDSSASSVNVTPLTSLVAELVINNSTTSIETARNSIATSMDIDLDTLNSDPIALLKDGNSTQKLKAAKMMKNILMVQKFAQVVSSVSSDSEATHSKVFQIIAEKLSKDSNLKLETMVTNTTTISSIIDDVKSSSSLLEQAKFDSIKEVTHNTLTIINDINETKLAESNDIDAQIKENSTSIEVVVISLANKLEDIKNITNETQLVKTQESAESVVKAGIALGGIDGITKTLADNNISESNTSITDFTQSFLTDDTISENSESYDRAVNNGDSVETIIKESISKNKDTVQTISIKYFGSLKGSLYKETTGDTSRSGSEAGLSNILITVKDSITTKTVVTDEYGYFTVSGLVVGDVNITVDLADTDMPEGVTGNNTYSATIEKDNITNIGNKPFTFGDANSIDPSAIARCENPISFTWDGSTVTEHNSSKTIWEDMAHNNFKKVVIGGYTVTLSYSDINGQFNNIDSGTANEDNTTTQDIKSKGVFGSPYLTLYLGNDNDKNISNNSLAKGDMMTMRVDFNDSVVLDNWLFRDIDSGDVRNGESGWDWQDAVKIKAYDAQENPVELTVNLSETTNLQIVNGVVRTEDNITTGAGTDTTDPKGHARWSSNGKAIKYMVVEFSSGTAISSPTRTAIAASGFSFCPVSATTAPTLTIVPTTTTNDNVEVELHGVSGARILVNGEDTNITISSDGSKTITLDTLGTAGTKTFKIELISNGVKSESLNISIDKTIPAATVTREGAIKFLRQAAFRMNEEEIASVISLGYEGWIDNQFSMSYDTNRTYMKDSMRILNKIDPGQYPPEVIDDPTLLNEDLIDQKRMSAFRSSVFWDKAINDKHQLRQRIAYALSQILVTADKSPAGQATTFRGEAMINYYDILYKHSLGNYRELLTDVTHSSTMGYFMTYVGGDKAAPDENYARELTQLFTVGLYELNDDGSLIGGATTPSFKQQHVTDLSKVFTGWDLDDKQLNSKGVHPRFGATGKTDGSWVSPLEFTSSKHDNNSTLHLFNGDITMTTSDNGSADIETALDLIFANHNVAPFISRHLIMRFITSNPTSEYLGRISAVFNDNGSGVKGDLKAVIKAILLDDEARGIVTVPNFGKVDEMLVSYPHFLSVFNVQPVPEMKFGSGSTAEKVRDIFWLNPAIAFQQALLGADNVFNFYSNEFVPSAPYFANNNLVAPELQIQNTPNLIGYSNLIKVLFDTKEKYSLLSDIDRQGNKKYSNMLDWAQTIGFGQFSLATGLYYVDLTPEYEVFEKALDNETTANGDFANMGDIDENIQDRLRAINALLTHLDNKLLGGTMPEAYKTQIIEHVQEFTHLKTNTGRKDRAKAIITITIQAIVTSPLFMVIK